ncbi:MAG: hypothetical protein CM15mP47_1610 [Methanobacteriota archaeon]|nr:MAG: hypothetical protein CM15mP47_1610 [Euryarchaeota archaeon]
MEKYTLKGSITYLNNGGNVKQFIQELKQMDFVNETNMGQILSYWNKKMLSQVFKWDDKSKALILTISMRVKSFQIERRSLLKSLD